MSSFRIDRQYVAFETAETQPVLAANKTKEAPPDTDRDMSADLSRLYDEIYEKLRREHAEQAELMLSGRPPKPKRLPVRPENRPRKYSARRKGKRKR